MRPEEYVQRYGARVDDVHIEMVLEEEEIKEPQEVGEEPEKPDLEGAAMPSVLEQA